MPKARPSMEDWDRARDFSDSFPEVCPICKEKWKHCEDYDRHADSLVAAGKDSTLDREPYDPEKETVKEYVDRHLTAEMEKELRKHEDALLYGDNSGGPLKGFFN